MGLGRGNSPGLSGSRTSGYSPSSRVRRLVDAGRSFLLLARTCAFSRTWQSASRSSAGCGTRDTTRSTSGSYLWRDCRIINGSERVEFLTVMTEIAPRITVDEKVRFGKPVIAGTRVPVDLVVGKLAGGMTVEEVMEEYELLLEDVLAAVA